MPLKADRFTELCELSGLNIVLRQDSPLWEEVYERLPYQSVSYLSSTIDYQLEYQRGHDGEWVDLSCVIFWDKNPIALWPLTVSMKDKVVNLSSQGRELLPPVFIKDCPRKTTKAIIASALKLVDLICDQISLLEFTSASVFDGTFALSNWHTSLMKQSAACHVRHHLYVDLSLPIENIKSCFRKSYGSLISTGERIWNVEALSNSIEREVWEEFRSLHLMVAGRATRSKESWDLQYRSAINNESLLVALRDDAGKMVGAGLFSVTKDEGSYAVGAYDRSLFDKPLGHIVQFRAIQELKKRGCRWYFIGQRFYPADQPTPSEKELSISNFNEGFSTHVIPSFLLVQNIL